MVDTLLKSPLLLQQLNRLNFQGIPNRQAGVPAAAGTLFRLNPNTRRQIQLPGQIFASSFQA
jgi:hypothetical protein